MALANARKRLVGMVRSARDRLYARLKHAGPMGDPYDRAEYARAVPRGELLAAEAILHSGGSIARRLLRQLEAARDVWRVRDPDGRFQLLGRSDSCCCVLSRASEPLPACDDEPV